MPEWKLARKTDYMDNNKQGPRKEKESTTDDDPVAGMETSSQDGLYGGTTSSTSISRQT